METHKKRLVLVVLAGIVGLLLLGALIVFLTGRGKESTNTSVYTDPMTGDEVYTVAGKSPEISDISDKPIILGGADVSAVMSNDLSFTTLTDKVLKPYFKDQDIVRINPNSVHKEVNAGGDVTTPNMVITFDVYHKDDNKNAYAVTVTMDIVSGQISAVIKDPTGKSTPFEFPDLG